MPRRGKNDDERWMRRALALARSGEALASPNPLVGAVLVKAGRVIGEGFHTYDSRKHAEIIALEKAGVRARGATLYINLEPCCHTGRTGPCTKALIAAGVRGVVAAMPDPNPAVCGRGFRELRGAGVKVRLGPHVTEAKRLNEAFARWIRTGLPFVTLKLAMTLDGKIAPPPGSLKPGSIRWITSPQSRAEVQQMRHRSDALLTGIGTVLADDPRLTDRTGRARRRPLLRVLLDSRLRLPLRSKLVRSAGNDLLVFTVASPHSRKARALDRAGVEVVRVRSRGGLLDLRAVLRELGRREILSVMLEPGARLSREAFRADIVDKLVLFVAPRVMKGGIAIAPSINLPDPGQKVRLALIGRCGPDMVMEGYRHDVYRDR